MNHRYTLDELLVIEDEDPRRNRNHNTCTSGLSAGIVLLSR